MYRNVLTALLTARSLLHLIVLFLGLGLSLGVLGKQTLSDQRYNYELAKTMLERSDMASFWRLYSNLGDYPLKPYLNYRAQVRHLKSGNFDPVERAVRRYQDTYVGDRLHRQFVYQLGLNSQWRDVIYWFDESLSSAASRCFWLEARVKTGDTAALAEIGSIWVAPKSLPKECDNVFSMWMKSDHFTPEHAWQRFLMAKHARNHSLSRYLYSLLSEDHKPYADLIRELDRFPNRIKDYKRFSKYTPEMQSVLMYGIRRYAVSEPVKALTHWQRYEAMHIFDLDDLSDTKTYLASRLIKHNELERVEGMLRTSPSLRNTATLEKLLRRQLKSQRWNDVLTTISLLPAQRQNSDRWRYWRARAEEQLGHPNIASYAALANKRSFYGFLSADKVGQRYELQHEPLTYSETTYSNVAQIPALKRAKELWLTGHDSEAYAEWYYGIRELSAKEIAAAGALAHSWGWHNRAIQSMIAGKHWNHIDIRFPLAHKSEFLDAANKTQMNPELLFAIARQESAMSEVAISSAGARGLMQLMPATARETAHKIGVPHKTEDLFDVGHNIKLGSQYLNELMQRYDGNRILAAAAYNAGPHRVEKWLTKDQQAIPIPYDIWIETIPFNETRSYVQNILTFSVIYSVRMGKPGNLIEQSEAKIHL